ncbi:MAG TPA: DUF4412 domain-containing protein [Verrucomicrobiae bacterium]|jgi:hypothetical protein|nr:DUF4412 domain-containing protein [Verrucomicrobiae bacterium]
MKKFLVLTATFISLGLVPAFAQLGMGGGQSPHFDSAMNKLFGDNKSFSAVMEMQTSSGDGNSVAMTGSYSFDNGKTRLEMNFADVKGPMVTPDNIKQMKTMGMDKTVVVSRPDLKLTYIIYPGLNSYAEIPTQDVSGSVNSDDYKIENTPDGKETVDGHDCVKNKATVTGKDGNKRESTVWNATDLKNFPVKIVTGDASQPVTMLYKNVSLAKPAASLFEAPGGFTKYSDVQTMMQTEMMKKMGGGAKPPGQ